MKPLFRLIIIGFLTLTLLQCGGRVPNAKTAQSMTQHFFVHYGKKYKESVLGVNPVQKVEINHIAEQSRNMADVEAFLDLSNEQKAHVLITFKKTPPFGWKILSWEMGSIR